MYQLDFFEKDDIVCIKEEILKVKESSDKVRKGTYARLNKLENLLIELSQRQQVIERHICK